MTTIAWDGKTLAADSCSWSGTSRRRTRKVFRVAAPNGSEYLVGFAGNGSFALATLAWMRGAGDRPDLREFMDSSNFDQQCAVVIDQQRRVWQLDYRLNYSRMRERVYAFGGGQDFAWGALEAGATARQAVAIAAKRSDYAGLGIDTVTF